MSELPGANVGTWVHGWALQSPDAVALEFEGRAIRFADLAARIEALTAALARVGVGSGQRVAMLGYNTPDYLAVVFACARLGAIAVPLNWRLAPPEHRFILQDSGACLLLCDPELVPAAQAIEGPDAALQRRVLGPATGGWEAIDTASSGAAGGKPAGEAVVGGARPLLLVYTSGTTGRPKGAVLSHEALLVNAVNAVHAHDLTSRDRILTNLPLFHVGGLNIQTLPALHAGATVILHRKFDPGLTLADLAARRPSLFLMVPATMAALIQHPDWQRTDLSSLRLAMAGASIIAPALIEAFHARGVPVGQIYGATETAPIAAYLRQPDALCHVGSTGKAAVHCQVRVVNADGVEVPAPGRGEVWVRGRNVMLGYWQNVKATRAALHDGWFATGDVGHFDAAGFLYIDDRLKDVIISGGENVYPAELENVLAECDAIAEAAVIGRTDARWGEVPVALVVLRGGERLAAEQVLALFDGRLARFKHPKAVEFRAALPRNAMGKILKYQLREEPSS